MTSTRGLVDDYPFISINDFGRGLIRESEKGKSGTLEPAGLRRLELSYEVNLVDRTLEFYGTTLPFYGYIKLGATESPYGRRPWFLCQLCGRKCAKLYKSGKSFSCRLCLGLTYPSKTNCRIPLICEMERCLRVANAAEKVRRIYYGGQLTRKARAVVRLATKLKIPT